MSPEPSSSRSTSAYNAPTFQVSRRRFLHRCAMAAAATGLPLWFVERQMARAAENPARPSANDRPAVALVGCGGMGKVDANNASHYADIVALCDVDETRLAGAVEQPRRSVDLSRRVQSAK